MKYTKGNESGYVMVYTLMMLAALMSLSAAYLISTKVEIATTRNAKDSMGGFYAAEAGLNLRAENVRQAFIGFNVPSGTGPTLTNPCTGNNNGTGDFSCSNYTFGPHTVMTYVTPDPANPYTTTIPAGEKFNGLTAYEYRYTTHAEARNTTTNQLESILELKFRSRNIPLYQFSYFMNKDYELSPATASTITGPMHMNYDMYINSGGTNPNGLSVNGQLTVSGTLYRGFKDDNTCDPNSVRATNPTTYLNLGNCGSGNTRSTLVQSQLTSFNNNVIVGFAKVTTPPVSSFEAGPGHVFWDRADLRLALILNASENPDTTVSSNGIIVVGNASASTKDILKTTALAACLGSPVTSASFRNYRINAPTGADMRILDIDLTSLLNCLNGTAWLGAAKLLNDNTDGGIVIHATVIGPNSAARNRYGVRIKNAAEIRSTTALAPVVRGIAIATDQVLFTRGDFNSVNKKPAALVGDQWHFLSNQWADSNTSYANRNVTGTTTINAAIVAGSGTTGGVNGPAGQGGNMQSGMFNNAHENFNGRTVNVVGSFVSLDMPNHGTPEYRYGSPYYTAPTRNTVFDTSFNNPANLPPLSLQFVYLREELFIRDFEQ